MNQRLTDTEQRGFFYALYSRLFMKEVDTDFLKTLEHKDIKEFFPNLYDWDLYQTLPKDELIERHLNVDFAEISLIDLIPYETFYTREDGMIESGGDNPIYQFYEEYDYIVEKDVARVVSPDHIGVELEFVYMLCDAEAKALKNSDEVAADELRARQKSFIETHLMQWAPLYFINVKNEAETPLYHDGAMTGLEFLLNDNEYLHA